MPADIAQASLAKPLGRRFIGLDGLIDPEKDQIDGRQHGDRQYHRSHEHGRDVAPAFEAIEQCRVKRIERGG